MTTSDAMLRGILEHPDEQDRRLVYADWLDDHDQSARATLIREMIAKGLGYPMSSYSEVRIVRDRHLKVMQDECDRLGLGLYNADWTEGFIAGIQCRYQQWLDRGPSIVRSHPVQSVRFTDLSPYRVENRTIGERTGPSYIWSNYALPDVSFGCNVPAEIFQCLGQHGSPERHVLDMVDWREILYYISYDDARIDLSYAALRYAKGVACG